MVVVQSLKKSRLTATFIKTAGTGKRHDGGGAGLIFKVSKNGRRVRVQRIVINGSCMLLCRPAIISSVLKSKASA
ncbi:MAG: Uncharacterised protein [Hyphomonas sp. TMED17]|nr:MAG: Uncharacterised protein [Hyphomonas sp. TMED17]